MHRTEVLQAAADLTCGERLEQYGPPQENFRDIAVGWSVLLGKQIRPDQVAMCMAWLKLCRLRRGPHTDSYIDGAAYLAITGELGGDYEATAGKAEK